MSAILACDAPAWQAVLLNASRAICMQLRATAVADGGSSFDALVEIDVDLDQGVQPKLLGQCRESADEVGPFEEVRPETEHEVADVADRSLDGVDRPVDAGHGLGRVLRHQRLDVLQRQRHGVQALDDPVVELLPDAVALLHDRQLPDLLVQSRVLDRDAGVEGKQLDQLLVRGRELTGPRLSVRYRLPMARPLTVTGTPSSERIGGWFGGKPYRSGCAAIRDPVRAALADDQPKQPVPRRWRTDEDPLLGCDADRDEALDPAEVDDPEGGVAGIGEVHTRSTISWSTTSRSSTPAIARVAASSASRASTGKVESLFAVDPGDATLEAYQRPPGTHGATEGPRVPGQRSLPARGRHRDDRRMRTHQPSPAPVTPETASSEPASNADSLSRRGFLRAAALTGGGLAAASIAACTPAAAPVWTFSPGRSGDPNAAVASPTAAAASPEMSHGPTPSGAPATPAASGSTDLPPGWSEHDIASRTVIRRYLGNLVPARRHLSDRCEARRHPRRRGRLPGAAAEAIVRAGAEPRPDRRADAARTRGRRRHEGLSRHRRGDGLADRRVGGTGQALGYNGQWPGPTIRVNQGDRVRAIFTNNLPETTSVHFHGVEFDDFFQDGVPFVTQKPIIPGEEYAYEFTAVNAGSHMYHSHHNATDQVGRGLLGAFIVEPSPPQTRYDREYIWISNDTLGGFTINGHGLPRHRRSSPRRASACSSGS